MHIITVFIITSLKKKQAKAFAMAFKTLIIMKITIYSLFTNLLITLVL